MRIAVVGPVHPFKGGVAQHTAALAEQLAARGHEVEVVSWLHQYPSRLYPGQLTIETPEFEIRARVHRDLSWNRPISWRRAARRLAGFDRVVFAHVSTFHAPVYTSILRRLRPTGARTVLICHNVRPHEARFFDDALLRRLFGAAGALVVHSPEQAEVAARLTDRPVGVATMPPFLPASFVRRHPRNGEHRRLLFFGLVRPYKGLDVLLRALAAGPPDVRLRIAGEFWGGTDATWQLIRELGLDHRVEVLDGYAPAESVPGLFADVDALVLPYRRSTGSQNTWIGFEFGVPVITTSAGRLADEVRHGVDGLVVPPDDVDALEAALHDFYQPGVPLALREAVGPVDPVPIWDRYVEVLLGA